MARRFAPLDLGPLPVDAINVTLGTELEAGDAYLSARAHEHIAADHPGEYGTVMRHIVAVIARPTFVGQAPHHGRNMELVGRVQLLGSPGFVLIAVSLERDDDGRYRVRSAYLLEEAKVEARRHTGHLRLLKR